MFQQRAEEWRRDGSLILQQAKGLAPPVEVGGGANDFTLISQRSSHHTALKLSIERSKKELVRCVGVAGIASLVEGGGDNGEGSYFWHGALNGGMSVHAWKESA